MRWCGRGGDQRLNQIPSTDGKGRMRHHPALISHSLITFSNLSVGQTSFRMWGSFLFALDFVNRPEWMLELVLMTSFILSPPLFPNSQMVLVSLLCSSLTADMTLDTLFEICSELAPLEPEFILKVLWCEGGDEWEWEAWR